jgi:hypothetical protein
MENIFLLSFPRTDMLRIVRIKKNETRKIITWAPMMDGGYIYGLRKYNVEHFCNSEKILCVAYIIGRI